MTPSSNRLATILIAGSLAAGACAGPGPDAVAVSENEKQALRQLHRAAVEIFVDRPGFGIRRLALNVDDLVGDPKSQSETKGPGAAAKPDPKAAKEPPHYAVRDMLVERTGRFATDDGEATWQVRQFNLVGLVKHRVPVVYLTDEKPKTRGETPKAGTDIPTRKPDGFESAALEGIRGGELLRAEKKGEVLRAFAPITAGLRCVACHERGALLGGFAYELERVAYDPAKDGVRPPRR
jgi:hypothetical protein